MNTTNPNNIENIPHISLPQALSFFKYVVGLLAIVGSIYLTLEVNQANTTKDIQALQTEIAYLKAKNREYVDLFNQQQLETRNNIIVLLEKIAKLEAKVKN
jgi:hypothetical protein